MPRKPKQIKQKQKQKQSQKVVVNINTTKRSYTRQQPSKSNIPSNNNKVPSVIVNMPSYNQPNNPINTPVANPINTPVANTIDNELLKMLNKNQENIHNALLRRVEPQREPINVTVNPSPINVHAPPINVTPAPINIYNNKHANNVPVSNIETQTEPAKPKSTVLNSIGTYLNNALLRAVEPEQNSTLLNSMETQTEYQPNALANSMETQTEMPILSYGDVFNEQPSIFNNTNRTFLSNIQSGDEEEKMIDLNDPSFARNTPKRQKKPIKKEFKIVSDSIDLSNDNYNNTKLEEK